MYALRRVNVIILPLLCLLEPPNKLTSIYIYITCGTAVSSNSIGLLDEGAQSAPNILSGVDDFNGKLFPGRHLDTKHHGTLSATVGIGVSLAYHDNR